MDGFDAEVAVVGAGPVGCVLALLIWLYDRARPAGPTGDLPAADATDVDVDKV